MLLQIFVWLKYFGYAYRYLHVLYFTGCAFFAISIFVCALVLNIYGHHLMVSSYVKHSVFLSTIQPSLVSTTEREFITSSKFTKPSLVYSNKSNKSNNRIKCQSIPRPAIACLAYNGRLGNQMFMYAFHYAFAKAKGLKMVGTGVIELFDFFNINKSNFLLASESTTKSCCVNGTEDPEHCSNKSNVNICSSLQVIGDRYDCGYDENLDALPFGKSVNLVGYFQSWRYWVNYEEEIRKQFTFKHTILYTATKTLHNMLSKTKWNYRNDTLIGVHIRRGDYASKRLIDFGQRTAPLEYIINAMSLMKRIHPRSYFLICSDTIQWAKENIPKEKNLIFSQGNAAEVDMAMLTLSNHSIITAGTYSWWVGFLTNGITIYYKDIFTRNTAYSAQFRDESVADFFPPTWIGI